MTRLDMRFDETVIKSWVGKQFVEYKCDPFDFTNSVTQIVGFTIGEATYRLTNIQETVDYYGTDEDIAVFSVNAAEKEAIKSAFSETEQIITPIMGDITKIMLVNENQCVESEGKSYDVWLTRAIIFVVDGREISFEKDCVPFSEEIIIRRGYNLVEKISDEKEFLEGWNDDAKATCKREIFEYAI